MNKVVAALLAAQADGKLVVEIGGQIASATVSQELIKQGYCVVSVEFASTDQTKRIITAGQYSKLHAGKYFIGIDLANEQDVATYTNLLHSAKVILDSRPQGVRGKDLYARKRSDPQVMQALGQTTIVLSDRCSEKPPEPSRGFNDKDTKNDIGFGLAVFNMLMQKKIVTGIVFLGYQNHQMWGIAELNRYYDSVIAAEGPEIAYDRDGNDVRIGFESFFEEHSYMHWASTTSLDPAAPSLGGPPILPARANHDAPGQVQPDPKKKIECASRPAARL